MKIRSLAAYAVLALVALILASTRASAADGTGAWTASFDTQVGAQNYTDTFKVEGGKLTGIAKSNLDSPETAQGSLSRPDDAPISGDEIKFTRTVTEGVTQDLVAKQVI
jgi:hypothetical protein